MAAKKSLATVILHFFCLFLISEALIPDLGVLIENAERLGTELNNLLDSATAISNVEVAYSSRAAEMELTPIDAEAMAETMTNQLEGLLAKKMEALNKSVNFAEELAKNHKWQGNLELGDIPYVDAKLVKDNDTRFVFDTTFNNKVNYENSSVHIPVEIYEGDLEILNGLSWTRGLDEIWRENKEKHPELIWQYFGSQSGIMRNYPGVDVATSRWLEDGVDLYDVRRRPWYTQGASSPKDMLILVDTSGSTHGQALSLMKQSVKSLLDTLGENDFVNVAQFSDKASWAGCFHTFVQANFRHKRAIFEYVDQLEAKGMASYTAGLEFAFEQFQLFYNHSDPWEGARCNPIIMFLTDGGTEMPEDLLKKYNPDKRVRIFSYAVGPTADPVEAAEWLACNNRGYFARIPSMGAIRSTVQDYMRAVPDGMSTADAKTAMWGINDDLDWGLGMMTTVTLPVYNKTQDIANQTILGVMGIDVTTMEMEKFIPSRKLGPNGYAFAINNNGYIVFHPSLKAQHGYLSDPPNVDFLDVEYENEKKAELRVKMINDGTGSEEFDTHVVARDEMHVDRDVSRTYSYRGIRGSNFSMALVHPSYTTHFLTAINPLPTSNQLTEIDGLILLQPDDNNNTRIILAPCYLVETGNGTDEILNVNPTLGCELVDDDNMVADIDRDALLKHLYFDAEVTAQIVQSWKEYDDTNDAVSAQFVSTLSGMTRVHPASAADLFAGQIEPWNEQYFQRALNNPDTWMFQVKYNDGTMDVNDTAPTVMVVKPVVMTDFQPAVVGIHMKQSGLRSMMMEHVPRCADPEQVCYLLDDGAYIMLTSDDNNYQVGRFLGDVDVALMSHLLVHNIFNTTVEWDFQANCPVLKQHVSAGIKSFLIPNIPAMMFDLLNLQWWTSKLSWAILNLNFYHWFYSAPSDFGAFAEEAGALKNKSCIKELTQYYMPDSYEDTKQDIPCGNCTRTFATAKVISGSGDVNTNLLLVIADVDSWCTDCEGIQEMNSIPVETSDPLITDPQAENGCTVLHRYRTRPTECYDFDEREDDTDCGGSACILPSLTLLLITSILALVSFTQHSTTC